MPIQSVIKNNKYGKFDLTFDEVVNEIKYHKRVFKPGRFIGRTRGRWVRVRKQEMVEALEASDMAYFQCDIIGRGILVRGAM